MAFDPGTKLQLGLPASWGGDLYAEGNADSLITFKPYNNTIGGWAGIYFSDWNDNWSGTSSLKYCKLEKAAGQNILCENSAQPTLDHCILSQSSGHGLKLSNSNILIRNSTIMNNTGNGILLEGTSSPTIGNGAAYTCSLFNNGGYEVYNNGTSDVNARYNYWGANDSTMVATRIYDKYDNSAKGIVYYTNFAQLPATTTPTMILSGNVKYANPGANPIKNAAMVIKNFSGTTIASTTTNASGVYAFSSIPSGNYQMTITPSAAWGGVNSTDALGILNHFAQITPLTGMGLAAADVNISHTINGTDALYVMKRYSALITSFPAGDYLYNNDTVIINGNLVTNNFKMICFGDVNASYAPALKSTSSVGLVYEGTLSVPSNSEFTLPVKVKSGFEVGAISLGFYYPEELLEITAVELANGNTNVIYSAENGLLKIAWCDLNAMIVGNNEAILIVKMRSKDFSGITNNIQLQLFEDSEFADGSANVIEGVTLSIPDIQSTLTGFNSIASGVNLNVYPNPAIDKTRIEFSLPEASAVKLSLYSMIGNLVSNIKEADYPEGDHQVGLNVANLEPGIYLLKIEIISNGQSSSKLIKVLVSN